MSPEFRSRRGSIFSWAASAVIRVWAELRYEAAQKGPSDLKVLLYLAELCRNGDQAEKAIPVYRRAIEHPGNTGAIGSWQDALAKNAGLEPVRINSGDGAVAERRFAGRRAHFGRSFRVESWIRHAGRLTAEASAGTMIRPWQLPSHYLA